MKKNLFILFSLLLLCFNCNNDDDSGLAAIDEPNQINYIGNIDFTSLTDEVSVISDFDIEGSYLYFIYGTSIYRVNLSLNVDTVEFIIEDNVDWPETLKVLGNKLYYQANPFWSSNQNIKEVDLNNITDGVQTTYPIQGISRSQFGKNNGKLYYVSSSNGFSPINNFYEFHPTSTDELIATDEFIFPQNMRVVDNHLYFSSKNEIRRFDLTTSSPYSTLVYTVPDIEEGISDSGDIIGFDIYENKIYFTRNSMNKLFFKDLEQPNQAPIVIKTNGDDGVTGYGKLIISEGRLFVKKIIDKELEVFELL